MTKNKLNLYINTLKHLRFKQVYYRLFYFIRNKVQKKNNYHIPLKRKLAVLHWKNHILNRDTYIEKNKFSFLNQTHQFDKTIDWNYIDFGKLWAYNLNYFDFLNQENISKEIGLGLINDFIDQKEKLAEGIEPYPISLRGINWIKFLSLHQIIDKKINQYLYDDYQNLLNNLEYHLLGNHLLENAYSLFFAAYHFKDDILYRKAKNLLTSELSEQILKDGAHYELSPMYHQILFQRLLDSINLVQLNQWKEDNFVVFLKEKASLMVSWLQEITYKNGSIPMVNDSAFDIAVSSNELFDYANHIGIQNLSIPLSESGYRKYNTDSYEFFFDVGNMQPSYQPGHAHADTFNFELFVNERPIVVDTGVSTYEKNERRQKERGTAAHNTVIVNDKNQSQVWGGFRVAKRAKVIKLVESKKLIEATHDGYKNIGVLHTRKVVFDKQSITISDTISNKIMLKQTSIIHFHPSVQNILIDTDTINLINEGITIHFTNAKNIKLEKYKYAKGFNKRLVAYKINIYFSESLKMKISI